VDILVGESIDAGDAGQFFCLGRIRVAGAFDFAPLLRCAVFVGEALLNQMSMSRVHTCEHDRNQHWTARLHRIATRYHAG
jgi:hypothetical protein